MLLHPRQNLRIGRVRFFIQQADSAQNHSSRAITALESPFGEERFLHRMKLIAIGQPLDRQDRLLVSLGNRCKTSGRTLAVDEHRAGSTLAFPATVFRSRQLQVLAQNIEQRPLGVGCDGSWLSVDGEAE